MLFCVHFQNVLLFSRLPHESALFLSVRVDSLPMSSFRWFFDELEITESEEIRIDSSESNVSHLVMSKPVTGEVKVVAKNVLGTAACAGRVQVEGE